MIVVIPEGYGSAQRSAIIDSIESANSDVTVVIKEKYGKPKVNEDATE